MNNYKRIWNNEQKQNDNSIINFCFVFARSSKWKPTAKNPLNVEKSLRRQIQTNFKSTGCRLKNHCKRYACQIERLNDLTFFPYTPPTRAHTYMYTIAHHIQTEPAYIYTELSCKLMDLLEFLWHSYNSLTLSYFCQWYSLFICLSIMFTLCFLWVSEGGSDCCMCILCKD